MGKKNVQTSESLIIGLVLAFAGGFLDIYTYMARGEVFANAQTGNMLLLGMNIAKGNINKALFYMLPIMAFVFGIVLSEVIRDKMAKYKKIHWRQMVLVIEIIILVVVMFIPQGNLNVLVNILISFLCAMQVQTFRKLQGNAFATTMCTGNLRSATDLLYKYFKIKDKQILRKSMQYYTVIIVFILGAIVGGIFTNIMGSMAVGITIIFFVAAIFLMREEKIRYL